MFFWEYVQFKRAETDIEVVRLLSLYPLSLSIFWICFYPDRCMNYYQIEVSCRGMKWTGYHEQTVKPFLFQLAAHQYTSSHWTSRSYISIILYRWGNRYNVSWWWKYGVEFDIFQNKLFPPEYSTVLVVKVWSLVCERTRIIRPKFWTMGFAVRAAPFISTLSRPRRTNRPEEYPPFWITSTISPTFLYRHGLTFGRM